MGDSISRACSRGPRLTVHDAPILGGVGACPRLDEWLSCTQSSVPTRVRLINSASEKAAIRRRRRSDSPVAALPIGFGTSSFLLNQAEARRRPAATIAKQRRDSHAPGPVGHRQATTGLG